jgi:predicted sulfurtransferase
MKKTVVTLGLFVAATAQIASTADGISREIFSTLKRVKTSCSNLQNILQKRKMKKRILILVAIIGFGISTSAQTVLNVTKWQAEDSGFTEFYYNSSTKQKENEKEKI